MSKTVSSQEQGWEPLISLTFSAVITLSSFGVVRVMGRQESNISNHRAIDQWCSILLATLRAYSHSHHSRWWGKKTLRGTSWTISAPWTALKLPACLKQKDSKACSEGKQGANGAIGYTHGRMQRELEDQSLLSTFPLGHLQIHHQTSSGCRHISALGFN